MEIMGWESFGVVGFDLWLLLQGQPRIAKPTLHCINIYIAPIKLSALQYTVNA